MKNRVRKNDGLPIVNGKKITPRSGYRRKEEDSPWSLRLTIFLCLLLLFFPSNGGEPKASTVAKPEKKIATENTQATPQATQQAAPQATPQNGEFPSFCSPEQLNMISKHLRPNARAATLTSKYARNPILARKFYASDDFKLKPEHTFFGVSLGWNNNDVPADTLRVGSRDPKHNPTEWATKLGLGMRLNPVSIEGAATRPAKLLVVDWPKSYMPVPAVSLEKLKEQSGYTDDELAIETMGLEKMPTALENLIRSQMPKTNGKVAADQPIHYLDIPLTDGADYMILKILMRSLIKDIRFMMFEYNDKGSWGGNASPENAFRELTRDLKQNGMVCYWTGKEETKFPLWRITDCWKPMYDHQHWALVSCVSVKHDDTKELALRMEKNFQATLRRGDLQL